MRRRARLTSLIALVLPVLLLGARTSMHAASDPDPRTLAWMQSVLDEWELTARTNLRVAPQPLSWIIFYDDSAAWHVSADASWLPSHTTSTATLRFAGRRYPIERVPNGRRLWVPERDSLPLVPRAVAMLYANGQKPFCIVPLPALYRRLADPDQADELDKLFLGVAMHELTHTRHLVDFGRRVDGLRARFKLPEDLDDNLIENRYSQDTAYTAIFAEERKALMDAVFAKTPALAKAEARKALALAEQRKKDFFDGDRAGLTELEDFFLVLEGAGMWAHYQAARRAAPKAEPWQRTLSVLMNRTGAWSQGEGLALFLLLDRFRPNWQASFMAPGFPSPFTALRAALR